MLAVMHMKQETLTVHCLNKSEGSCLMTVVIKSDKLLLLLLHLGIFCTVLVSTCTVVVSTCTVVVSTCTVVVLTCTVVVSACTVVVSTCTVVV